MPRLSNGASETLPSDHPSPPSPKRPGVRTNREVTGRSARQLCVRERAAGYRRAYGTARHVPSGPQPEQPPGSGAACFSEHKRGAHPSRYFLQACAPLDELRRRPAPITSEPARSAVMCMPRNAAIGVWLGLWYDVRCRRGRRVYTPARPAFPKRYMGLSSFDGLYRGQGKQAELRALLKRSQRVYTRTTTTHSLPNLG